MRGALFPLVSELRINKREFRKFPTFCCQKVSICICLRYMQRQYCSQERGQRCSPCCSGLHAPASDPSDLISCLVIFTSLSHSSQLSPPSAQGKLNMRVAGHFTTLESSLGDYFSKSSVQCQFSLAVKHSHRHLISWVSFPSNNPSRVSSSDNCQLVVSPDHWYPDICMVCDLYYVVITAP